MRRNGSECRTIEERSREHVQVVEPSTRLAVVLDDEVARIVRRLRTVTRPVEPFRILERVMHLGVRHRARLEPAVENLGNAAHRRIPGRVIGIGPRQIVDVGTMQVVRAHAEVALELVERAVHVGTRVLRVVGDPHRDRRAPVAVAADVPVACTLEPLAELPVADVCRRPGDLLVQLDHAVLDRVDRDEPRRNGHVDQRLSRPPRVRVRVLDGLVPHHTPLVPVRSGEHARPTGLEVLDDRRVGVEHHEALIRRHLRGESATCVEWLHDLDAVGRRELHVLLTESRCEMDDSGTAVGGHVIAEQYAVSVGVPDEEVERRCVRQPLQVAPLIRAQHLGVDDLLRVAAEQRLGEEVLAPVRRTHMHIGDIGIDGDREVRRQSPGRRGPDQRIDPVQRRQRTVGVDDQRHAHGESGVLAHAVRVVELRFLVAQGCLLVPGVRQHAIALIDEALVPEPLECPHHRLHEVDVEGLVIVVEVDPTSLTGDVVTPLTGVAQHGVATEVVELLDAHLLDLRLIGDPELTFGLEFCGQSVGVPAESPLDLLAAHRLVPRYQILHVTGQQVTVVGQAVGERRPVVEDELRSVGSIGDGCGECVVVLPIVENVELDVGERWRTTTYAAGHVDDRVHTCCRF